MAVQDDLQSLITELDRLLDGQTGSRFSGLKPTEKRLNQDILHKIRHYFLSLQNSESISVPASSTLTSLEQEIVEQLAQMVTTQIECRLTECFQPLQSELEELRQQQQVLYQDIQQLETQRQQIITVQQQFEQLLMTFNSTLRTAFETLDKDLDFYHDSLTQGLERMHNLGQQGEARFLAYFNRLQQQLEQSLNQDQFLYTQVTSPLKHSEKSAEIKEDIETIQNLTKLINLDMPQPGWYLALDWDNSNFEAFLSEVKCLENKNFKILLYPLEKSLEKKEHDRDRKLLNWQNKVLINQSIEQKIRQDLETIFTSNQITSVELLPEILPEVLGNLQGIILNFYSASSETEISNFCQEILGKNLVQLPQQIRYVSPTIAVLLFYFSLSQPLIKSTTTLIIYSGKTSSEIALVNLPENCENLTQSDFTRQNFNYGADYLDQDILSQIIYPQWVSRLNPTLGQLDCQSRDTLKHSLQTHPLGYSFLEAARLARLILQDQEAFTSTLGKQPWEVTRQGVKEKVIFSFFEDLNQGCNTLLNQTGNSEANIQQIIYSGETLTSLEYAILPWLKDKFPQAHLITNIGEERDNTVAIGLANLPLFPSLFNI